MKISDLDRFKSRVAVEIHGVITDWSGMSEIDGERGSTDLIMN